MYRNYTIGMCTFYIKAEKTLSVQYSHLVTSNSVLGHDMWHSVLNTPSLEWTNIHVQAVAIASHRFECRCAVVKTTATSYTDDVFCSCILVRDASAFTQQKIFGQFEWMRLHGLYTCIRWGPFVTRQTCTPIRFNVFRSIKFPFRRPSLSWTWLNNGI